MKLNDQERAFAHNLVSGMTIVDAALNAGYAESTARDMAAKWIGNDRSPRYKPDLVSYIENLRSEIKEEVKMDNIASVQEVQELQTLILRTSLDKLMSFDGYGANPLPFDEMGDAVKVIHKFKFRKGEGVQVETYSKMDAARELMKFHGGYAPTKSELSGKDGKPIQVENKNFIDIEKLSDEEKKQALKLIFGNNAE